MQELMAKASAIVLGSFELRSDVKIMPSSERYWDPKGNGDVGEGRGAAIDQAPCPTSTQPHVRPRRQPPSRRRKPPSRRTRCGIIVASLFGGDAKHLL